MRTEDRVIPDLLCGRDEHLVRDTQAPELRGRQGAAATHRAASVAYAVTGAALTGWPGGTCGYRPISARSHRRVASPQPSTTLPTPWCRYPRRQQRPGDLWSRVIMLRRQRRLPVSTGSQTHRPFRGAGTLESSKPAFSRLCGRDMKAPGICSTNEQPMRRSSCPDGSANAPKKSESAYHLGTHGATRCQSGDTVFAPHGVEGRRVSVGTSRSR